MTWSVSTSGTYAGSTTETNIHSSTLNSALTYVCAIDTVNMVAGDLITIRAYDQIDGTNYRQAWKGTYQHVQIDNAKESPPLVITSACKFTLIMLSTTSRNFPFAIRQQ